MIQIQNLTKSFGKHKVLHDISVNFEAGRIYGVVGENGAGKTTFFRCIANLEEFDGRVKSEFKTIKNHLGFLPTNPVFMSKMTAWEYLKLICVARKINDDDFEQQNIFDLPLNQYAETFSTGMKKKLALMGILLQQNAIFILDEPFNGVDIHSNMMIMEIIHELKRKGKIVLISSHIFSSLAECCDEILHLKEGQIQKTVDKADFASLDEEMKSFIVGNQIKKLRIL